MMCDWNLPTLLQENAYKTAIQAGMAYGTEYWSVRKKQERKEITHNWNVLVAIGNRKDKTGS